MEAAPTEPVGGSDTTSSACTGGCLSYNWEQFSNQTLKLDCFVVQNFDYGFFWSKNTISSPICETVFSLKRLKRLTHVLGHTTLRANLDLASGFVAGMKSHGQPT